MGRAGWPEGRVAHGYLLLTRDARPGPSIPRSALYAFPTLYNGRTFAREGRMTRPRPVVPKALIPPGMSFLITLSILLPLGLALLQPASGQAAIDPGRESPPAAVAPQRIPLNVGHVSITAISWPFWAAESIGSFDQEGLAVDVNVLG